MGRTRSRSAAGPTRTLRGKVVETVTPKKKKGKRWFYIDIRKALDPSADREEAIIGVPEDRVVRKDFGREAILDLSSPKQEYALLLYPVAQVFEWDKWQDGFDEHWIGDLNKPVRARGYSTSTLRRTLVYPGALAQDEDSCSRRQGEKPSAVIQKSKTLGVTTVEIWSSTWVAVAGAALKLAPASPAGKL